MDKKTYSILMPPPNLTGEPHAGHTIQHLIMDALARFKRMQGFDTRFQPGVDHAGIQFEGTLNKLLEKEDLSKQKLGREKWMERAFKFKDEVYKSFHTTWQAMGISADWDKELFTLDPKVQQAVLEQFKKFFEDDLLYKGAYIVQWCPKDQTAIESEEMEYQEKTEKLYFVKYKTQDSDEYITVATARPETIFADVAIATYPNHPQFASLVGKTVVNPLTNNPIPVIEDDRVDIEFGTGALKITPGHDPLDYAIGKNYGLPILHSVDKTGKMTDLTGELAGLKVSEARDKAAQKLEELGALEKTEDYTHSVPVCERCKAVIEPLVSEEWFVRMKPLADKAIQGLGEINFVPSNFSGVIKDWLENIHDWSISRSLWWGHRIPVWYCSKCNPNHEVGKTKDMVISLEEPGKTCQSCSEKHWVQDEKILDTWFSSGLWPLATLGWPEETEDFKKYYPFDFEISAPEIKFLWIARMIMLGLYHTDQVPFKNMFFTGTLRDLNGQKFSKSLGNGLYPLPFIDTWGVDAYRMAIYTFTAPARDGRAGKQTLDERCKNFRNFSTKLKNLHRFIYELKPTSLDAIASLQHDDDKLILEQLNKTVSEVTKHLDGFNLHLATDELYNFVWHSLADIYVEKSKSRRAEAQPCLESVFETSLKLLYPFMPFTVEELWNKIYPDQPIQETSWPKANS
jgi:valyl-tRNA synthetase